MAETIAWRPANGTEAFSFQETVCARCTKAESCAIFDLAFFTETDDQDYPPELRCKPDCTGALCIAFTPARKD